ncbi:hypothetical protein BP5796_01111 [Coleophoma crateriformis]|uniref:Histone deacetylase n=1 Tax=Coleophoma crateriformis TaxID=565419 RepID=A0A3D8TCN7_9HELO|nr:hypothetical protein BP5796_01111 [Coleophoma crateriformis]
MGIDGVLLGSLEPSSGMETPMEGVESETHSNGNGTFSNGTIDPRTIYRIDEVGQPESEQDKSPSQSSSEPIERAISRRFYLPTGCCYDDRMRLHANADYSTDAHHPEDPRRIEAIMNEFKDADLVYTGPESDLEKILRDSPTRYMWRISAREATEAEICTVHYASHFDWVVALSEKSSAELREMTTVMDTGRKSLYVGNLTHMAALISAGGAIETCKNVVTGKVKNAIAVIRPPGHHAEPNESLGFCIFNNVPIAARVCQNEYPEICRKVLILDWDVHHGNGVQTMFYDDPNVLYISIHVYQNGIFYPGQPDNGGPDGGMENVGIGLGCGKNVNIPWHDQGMGDGEYLAAFQKIVMPIAQEFDPDLVIVSAGFDAAAGDELGGCLVTPACYAHMTHMLMSLASGKVAVCLEGGYNLRAISKSALAVAKTLMGEPPERISIRDNPLNATAAETLKAVQRQQAPYWDCMRPGVLDVKAIKEQGGERMDAVIQSGLQRQLIEKFKMVSVYIQRDGLSKLFENQVVATPGLYNAKKILLIIHDPPQMKASVDPITGDVESYNAYIVEGIAPYIGWAIKNDFGVLDVNIPLRKDEADDDRNHASHSSEAVLEIQMKELLLYLWDNYLSIAPAGTPIIVMGVGASYLGIKQLLLSRPACLNTHIQGVIAFVSNCSLKSVRSETDPNLSKWYKENSFIYVSPTHSIWNDELNARKVRKQKFGHVVRSEVAGLGAMLKRYGPEAVEWIAEHCDIGEVSGDETEEESTR